MNIETLSSSPDHFTERHIETGEKICMQFNGRCCISIEIDSTSEEEQEILGRSAEEALRRLDNFFDGRFAELFQGLKIKIADGLTKGGGEALPDQNLIILDRQKNLMSLVDAERLLIDKGMIAPEDAGKLISAEESKKPGSPIIVGLVHELGHILDETTEGSRRHRVSASESPTKYGREPDEWHNVKDHEAFAEGFTHIVFGQPVTPAMEIAVKDTIKKRMADLGIVK